jgi:serine/threonine protein kinase
MHRRGLRSQPDTRRAVQHWCSCLQVLHALAFLHGLSLIHCDLKPENIMVADFGQPRVKLIDLGSSCFTHDRLTSYVQARARLPMRLGPLFARPDALTRGMRACVVHSSPAVGLRWHRSLAREACATAFAS